MPATKPGKWLKYILGTVDESIIYGGQAILLLFWNATYTVNHWQCEPSCLVFSQYDPFQCGIHYNAVLRCFEFSSFLLKTDCVWVTASTFSEDFHLYSKLWEEWHSQYTCLCSKMVNLALCIVMLQNNMIILAWWIVFATWGFTVRLSGHCICNTVFRWNIYSE